MAHDYTPVDDNDLSGFGQRLKEANAGRVASAAALWADLISGTVPAYFLQEALAPRTPAVARAIAANYPGIFRETMTTSDFASLTGDVIDRIMLAQCRDFPAAWRSFAGTRALRDFRSTKAILVDGADSGYTKQSEAEELEYAALSDDHYLYTPAKYSLGVKLSFELLMNDDIGAFESVPARLGRGGARSVSKFVTGLYVGASGPNGTFFSGGNGNVITGNPVLNMTNVNAAWTQFRGMRDANGQPIMVEAAFLVVPPALEATARSIVNALTIRTTTGVGASGVEVEVSNWIGSSLTVVVDPFIPMIATSNAGTSWFLFAAPNTGRPAIEVGFVRGFNEPVLYQKIANTARVGGGIDQMAGDFSTMSQEWKGVVAFGGSMLSPKSAMASNGSGS